MFSAILVPLDGSAEAAVALPPAQALAQATRAGLVLLRVTPPEPHDRDAAQAAEAQVGLDRIAAELTSSGLRVLAVVRRGDPGEAIADEAVGRGVGLVVMATHGRGGLARAVIGSVTQHVLARVRIPVVLLRPGGHRTTRLRTLLVPVDGTPGGALAMGAAIGLARAAGARIVLLEVVAPIPAYVYGSDGWMGAPGGFYVHPEWAEQRHRAAQGYTGGMAERLRRAGVQAEGRAIAGDVVETIEAVATEVDADLIVMSTHALTGPARALLGSVADAVVRSSHRPVLLVRRDSPGARRAPSGETIQAATAPLQPTAAAGAPAE
jgi:nucleotide-binding universal stress UspA family protein